MRRFEINGNLNDEVDGLKNYECFKQTVCAVRKYFIDIFGQEFMESIPLLVDNATHNSGYTPIITVALGQYLIIKLNIDDNDSDHVIAYQFAHELMHYVFFAAKGLNREKADEREESICTAVSLIVLKEFYPDGFEIQNKHVKTLQNEGYRRGADLAASINYDMQQIKNMI